tara:strand:+ start:218 stop:502 length:285 start_codon:yes stop_codon:yes gene_type:complete
MDNKFLHKVVDQIVSETEIDYGRKVIETPFPLSPFFFLLFSSSYSLPSSLFLPSSFSSFLKHCKEVYGLNEEETEYVWNEYKDIIIDKIKNNGL